MAMLKGSLKILTPMHIGCGQTLNKMQYARFDDRVYIFDESKLITLLTEKKLMDNYIDLLQDGRINNSIFFTRNFSGEETVKKIAHYMVKADSDSEKINTTFKGKSTTTTMNDISVFIKNHNMMPYIPGSSIKGAIRNAILHNKITATANSKIKAKYWDKIYYASKEQRVKRELGKIATELEKELLNKNQPAKEFLRNLQVSDTNYVDTSALKIYRKIDTFNYKAQSPLPIYYECLKFNTELNLSVKSNFKKEALEKVLATYTKFVREIIKNEFDNCKVRTTLTGDIPNIILGGNTGFYAKSLIYCIAPDIKSAAYVVKKCLDESFNNRKTKNPEGQSFENNMSPRALNTYIINNKGTEYKTAGGFCLLKLEEMP